MTRYNNKAPLTLATLLGKDKLRFMEEVLAPRINELANQGILTKQHEERLAKWIHRFGTEALNGTITPFNQDTLTTMGDGDLFLYALELAPEVTYNAHIKVGASNEDFQAASNNMHWAQKNLRGTPHAAAIPRDVFASYEKEVLITSLLDGTPLKTLVEQGTPLQPLFRNIAQQYKGMFTHLNRHRTGPDIQVLSQAEAQATPLFHGKLGSFTDYWTKNYGASEALQTLFQREIGAPLDNAREGYAHGDLHGANALITPDNRLELVDWPKLVSNGFMEYDLGTLIRKSSIPFTQQQLLTALVAEELARTGISQEESFARLLRNQVKEDLVVAQRYVQQAEKNEEHQTRWRKSADQLFGAALERVATGIEHGIFSNDFKEALEQEPPRSETYIATPTTPTEQAETSPFTPVTRAVLENQPRQERASAGLELQHAVKKERKQRWQRNMNIAGILATAVATVGIVVQQISHMNREAELYQIEAEYFDGANRLRYADGMKTLFSEAYDLILNTEVWLENTPEEYRWGPEKNVEVVLTSPRLWGDEENPPDSLFYQLEQQYGFPEHLLLRMATANRLVAGESRDLFGRAYSHLLVVDPIRLMLQHKEHTDSLRRKATSKFTAYIHETIDLRENAIQGAEYLARLREKYDGDLALALGEYIIPVRDGAWAGYLDEWYAKIDGVPDGVNEWVHAAMNGVASKEFSVGAQYEFGYFRDDYVIEKPDVAVELSPYWSDPCRALRFGLVDLQTDFQTALSHFECGERDDPLGRRNVERIPLPSATGISPVFGPGGMKRDSLLAKSGYSLILMDSSLISPLGLYRRFQRKK